MATSDTPLLGIWGRSDAGKTRMVEQLLPRLRKRGLRIGTVKHARHPPDLDVVGKDSYRHGKAGADRVLLLGPEGACLFVHQRVEDALEPWLPMLAASVDLVIIEGFRRTAMPHVEIIAGGVDDFRLERETRGSHPAWIVRRPPIAPHAPLSFPEDIVDTIAAEVLRTIDVRAGS